MSRGGQLDTQEALEEALVLGGPGSLRVVLNSSHYGHTSVHMCWGHISQQKHNYRRGRNWQQPWYMYQQASELPFPASTSAATRGEGDATITNLPAEKRSQPP